MSVDIEIINDILILTPNGPLIEVNAYDKIGRSFKKGRDDGATAVVVDLRNVTLIDSSVLGVLVSGQIILGPSRRINLCGMSGPVEESVRLTKLDKVFQMFRDLDAAVTVLDRTRDERRQGERRTQEADDLEAQDNNRRQGDRRISDWRAIRIDREKKNDGK